MLLEKIDKPEDVKKLTVKQLPVLAEEIRKFIIEKISRTGGHLASNLGVVELTIALFKVLDMSEDKIIWDVGHQSYTHKILSGRKDDFDSLRQIGGISGFPKRNESPFDAFDTGHSSTSISAGVGMVQARELQGKDYTVVSVIGDGSLTGGMAYEALNNAAELKSNFIIVLNDNEMSISRNVGGISRYLGGIRTGEGYARLKRNVESGLRAIPGVGDMLAEQVKKTKDSLKQMVIPGMFFEDMGITYLGPVNGHNTAELIKTLRYAKKLDHAVLLHVITRKGKGYAPAENNPGAFHGIDPFDIKTGAPVSKKAGPSYTSVFSDELIKLAEKDKNIVAVTAAMPDGTGLSAFARKYPKRFFDVGIAEAHAVTSSAGMAAAGLKPVIAVYSSFLQRGFDQIVHDVCLQNLPVVFAIDRAGLVGADGETHQGIFDISYLSQIPNMKVLAPKNADELRAMLAYAFNEGSPVAVRYPRGVAYTGLSEYDAPIVTGKSELIHRGSGIAFMALGSMVSTAEHIVKKLKDAGLDPSFINARFAKPIDFAMIDSLAEDHSFFVSLEENVSRGGFGESCECYIHEHYPHMRVFRCAIPDGYVEHGDVTRLRKLLGIDSDSIIEKLKAEGFIDLQQPSTGEK